MTSAITLAAALSWGVKTVAPIASTCIKIPETSPAKRPLIILGMKYVETLIKHKAIISSLPMFLRRIKLIIMKTYILSIQNIKLPIILIVFWGFLAKCPTSQDQKRTIIPSCVLLS